MVTVQNLTFLKPISDFKLITSENGLRNVVKDTGILEYESNKKIAETFKKGDFIVTTLFLAKDNLDYAEKCLKSLIDQEVSAIAVKNIYFNDFSEDLKKYAEIHSCPIFIFEDIFFDDIIVTLKNAIAHFNATEYFEKKIESIISCDSSRDRVRETAFEINGSFLNNLVSAYCIKKEQTTATWQYLNEFETKPWDYSSRNYPHATILSYKKGLLVLYTMDHHIPVSYERLHEYLRQAGISEDSYRIGVSNIHFDLCELDFCIKESMCAYISCKNERSSTLNFNDIGIDQVLLPLINNYWMKTYYTKYMNRVLTYDKTHSSNLMDTMVHYVESKGEITQTSKKTFQHTNTVRYKLERVKKLMGFENDDSFYVQLYIVVRLYMLEELLNDI